MNKNLLLLRFLKSVKNSFSFNLHLIEEAENLSKAYEQSLKTVQDNYLNEDQNVKSFSSKEALLIAIRNNFIQSYPKPVADSLIKEYSVSVEKNLDIIFSFEEKFNLAKEKLHKEYLELNKVLGFNLVSLLEENIFIIGSTGVNKIFILENFNKHNSSLALINDIIFILEQNC